MLRLSVRNYMKLCKNYKFLFILSFVCLICAFVCFLLLEEKGYCAYLEGIKRNPEKQLLFVSAEDDKAIGKIYKAISSNRQLPKAGIVTISNDQCSGVYWDKEYDENICYIPSGRFFFDEEMRSGADVALVSMGYLTKMKTDQINKAWDEGILIDGHHFDVIGNYNFWIYEIEADNSNYMDLFLPTLTAVPIQTFLKLDMKASFLRLIFSRGLTQNEINMVRDLIDNTPGINSYILPKNENHRAYSSYFYATGTYTLILVMSLISIISIIVYWTNGETRRYRIYILCGAKRFHIIFLMSMTTFLLVTSSYAVSVALTLLLSSSITEGILAILPLSHYIVIYIGIVAFLIFMVNVKAIPVLYSNKSIV